MKHTFRHAAVITRVIKGSQQRIERTLLETYFNFIEKHNKANKMPKVIDSIVILYIACCCLGISAMEATGGRGVTSAVNDDDEDSVTAAASEDNLIINGSRINETSTTNIGLMVSNSNISSSNSSNGSNGQRKYLHNNATTTTINVRRTASAQAAELTGIT